MDGPELPRGGIDLRKYAAIYCALGLARNAMYSALEGNVEYAKRLLDLTAGARIAEALGYRESDIAVDWDEHLTQDEIDRLAGKPWANPPPA